MTAYVLELLLDNTFWEVVSMAKLISIIVPCYNVEQYIDRCVNSLLQQTIGLDNLELIFINDASPDHTIDKLLEYERLYPNDIMVINSEINLKQGGARNLGLVYASADYIGYVDSDDWVEATMYEKLYEKAIAYDCDFVCCQNKRVANEGTSMGRTGKNDQFYIIETEAERKDLLLTGIGDGIWSKLYKKSFLIDNNIFFPEHLSYEDNYFAYLLVMYVKRIYFLEDYLYHYFINLNSTVVSKNASHHFDRLTVELMKLEALESRGFMSTYHSEIEYNFLLVYYLNTLHIIFTRFQIIPTDTLSNMRIQVKEHFPDYKDNPYVKTLLSNLYQILLKTIELPMKPTDWQNLAESYRRIC